jgi:hypothetical protein
MQGHTHGISNKSIHTQIHTYARTLPLHPHRVSNAPPHPANTGPLHLDLPTTNQQKRDLRSIAATTSLPEDENFWRATSDTDETEVEKERQRLRQRSRQRQT